LQKANTMTPKDRLILTLFVLFCLLSCYSFGTAMMDYFLLYPSRYLVGEREFAAYHQSLEGPIFPVSVIPFLVIILLNGVLLWLTPHQVSRTLLWLSMACLVIDFLSTVFFQAPWNFELGKGKDLVLLQKITDTNWLRVFLESVQVIVVFVLMNRFVFRHASRASD
jgi:hypothetical protein